MHYRVRPLLVPVALTVTLGLVPGCRTAGTTAALASAAAIVLNDQNAEADIAGSIQNVDGRAKKVLRDLGLVPVDASAEDHFTEYEYEARNGDRVVHLKLEARSATVTKVAVSSRVGTTLNYDVSHARMVVERIRDQR